MLFLVFLLFISQWWLLSTFFLCVCISDYFLRIFVEVESEIIQSWVICDFKRLDAYCQIAFYKACTNLHFCQQDKKCLSVYIWQQWIISLFLIGTTFDGSPVHCCLFQQIKIIPGRNESGGCNIKNSSTTTNWQPEILWELLKQAIF